MGGSLCPCTRRKSWSGTSLASLLRPGPFTVTPEETARARSRRRQECRSSEYGSEGDHPQRPYLSPESAVGGKPHLRQTSGRGAAHLAVHAEKGGPDPEQDAAVSDSQRHRH